MLFADIGDLLNHGFKEQPGHTETESAYYHVAGLLSMNASETNITVTIKLLCSGERVQYKTSAAGYCTNEVDENAPYRTFYEHTQELWDTHRPHTAIDLANQQAPTTSAKASLPEIAIAAQNILSSCEEGTSAPRDRVSAADRHEPRPSHYPIFPHGDCDDEDDEEPLLLQRPCKRPGFGWTPVNDSPSKQQAMTYSTPNAPALGSQAAQGHVSNTKHTGLADRPQRTQPKPAGFYNLNDGAWGV
ncbi:hypothetical protein LTS14_006507 [Recurvomyces mirabilis]|nr:hypothetical protein LTS14_006507 [Recurvomyces mirabilis]